MPMTVITLTNVPNSLRGDLSKWLQEISTGVYVGNINSRLRDEVWERVIANIKQGEATMSYGKRNEIGYDFITHNTKREVIYYDGIPLVFLPKELKKTQTSIGLGFSNAAKNEKIKRFSRRRGNSDKKICKDFVIIDVETTGINPHIDQIIEVAAIKRDGDQMLVVQELVKIEGKLKKEIIELTGITDEMLNKDGKTIEKVLLELLDFIGDAILVGYNIKFDIKFINAELEKNNMEILKNKSICLMEEARRTQKMLRDYKLSTVLKKYDISTDGLHRAYVDAKAEYELGVKLNIF